MSPSRTAQLDSSDANNEAWHRAIGQLDEIYFEKDNESRKERNADAKARLLRDSEHARRVRSALGDLYYFSAEKLAAQLANPPTDPVEPEPSEPSATAAPSTSKPINDAERNAEVEARAREIVRQAAETVRKDVHGYATAIVRSDEGDRKAA